MNGEIEANMPTDEANTCTCLISYEEFDRENVLCQSPCQHIMCTDCAEDLILRDPNETITDYPCPLCVHGKESNITAAGESTNIGLQQDDLLQKSKVKSSPETDHMTQSTNKCREQSLNGHEKVFIHNNVMWKDTQSNEKWNRENGMDCHGAKVDDLVVGKQLGAIYNGASEGRQESKQQRHENNLWRDTYSEDYGYDTMAHGMESYHNINHFEDISTSTMNAIVENLDFADNGKSENCAVGHITELSSTLAATYLSEPV